MTQPTVPTKLAAGRDEMGNVVYIPLIDTGLTDSQGNHLVSQNSQAVARPIDVGIGGAYLVTAISGAMAAGLAGGSTVFSLRWSPATAGMLALVHRVEVAMVETGTVFTAGIGLFQLWVARSYSVNDTGGTPVVLSGNNNKLRTSHATSQMANMQIAGTGAMTPGTRTLDANDIGLEVFGVPATTNTTLLPMTDILNRAFGDGDWPVTLANNEGLVLTATVPALGTWQFAVSIDWLEVASY